MTITHAHECVEIDYDVPKQHVVNEEGIYVGSLGDGAVLTLATQGHRYVLMKTSGSQVCIFGHPRYCPEPVAVEIMGSFSEWPITSAVPGFIGRGMYLMFRHPVFDKVTTSRIVEIREM